MHESSVLWCFVILDQFHASSALAMADRANGVPSGSFKKQVSDGRKVISLRTNERNLPILKACGNDQNSPSGQTYRSSISTCKGGLSFDRVETEEMEINQVPELLPESPPSFGDAKEMGSKVSDSGGKESVSSNFIILEDKVIFFFSANSIYDELLIYAPLSSLTHHRTRKI